ncbi:MAG: TetR family transcriptional regulator C-terminal domain-containing protein [Deltaproteobacteria bacterium]|nr:TetR family transcriptional regulator C-terminal domain-containing protein [Deltaproteobacteria bacterium]
MEVFGQEPMVRLSALGGSAADRLRAMARAGMDTWGQESEIFPLVMEFWAASRTPEFEGRFKEAFRQAYALFRSALGAVIADGISRGEFSSQVDVKRVAAACVGAMDAILLQAWFDPAFQLMETTEGFMDVFIGGLAAPAKPSPHPEAG